MDKYEYKHLVEQIQSLIEQREYAEAVAIADRIDWRRVRSVMMLGTISDLYKINHRFEDARDIMLLAYDRKPENRQICYSLCELYIKTGEMVEAVEFYKEFVQLAPRDPGRYVLQYKLYEANEVSLEERCEVLEELKKHDYQEKWMYELATLYHRMGLATQCVEVCDELILWFGSGKYVNKAMELKMLHEQLTPDQQARYDRRHEPEMIVGTDITGEIPVVVDSVKTSEPGQEEIASQAPEEIASQAPDSVDDITRVFEPEEVRRQLRQQAAEPDIQVRNVDVSAYGTMNLQAEIAAGLREVLAAENTEEVSDRQADGVTRAMDAPMSEEEAEAFDPSMTGEMPGDFPQEPEVVEQSEVYFGETGEMVPREPEDISGYVMAQMRRESMNQLEQEAMTAQPPEPMAQVMTQEADGQIKLVLPENPNPEKQITGQLSIEDIRAEWERMKKASQEKQEEEVRQQVIRQTGRMFTEFEEAMRDDILRQMEEGRNADMLSIKPSKSPEQGEEVQDSYPEQTEDHQALYPEQESTGQESTEKASVEQSSEEQEAGDAGEDMVFDTIDEEDPSEYVDEAQAEEPDGTEEAGEEDYETIEDVPIYEEVQSEWGEDTSDFVEDDGEWEPVDEPETEEPEADEPQAEESEADEPEAEDAEADEPEAEDAEADQPEAEESVEKDGISEESAETSEKAPSEQTSREPEQVRAMTREEKELFSTLIQGRAARAQLVKALDNISLAAYTGNVIISGEAGTDTFGLAKNIIRAVQMGDSNFAGKVAKISGNALNGRDVAETIQSLQSGGLIVTGAAQLNDDTLREIYKALQHDNFGIVLIIIDTKKNLKNMMRGNEEFRSLFTAYVDLRPMSIEALAAFAQQYAREQEFCIGDLGMLALHTKIDEMQSVDHSVTLRDVKYIMDDAIASASRKSIGHFIDILFGRRYDDEDMIVITEKDFQ